MSFNTIQLTGRINEIPNSFILDSGASKNFIGQELAKELYLDIKEDSSVEVKFANNEIETSKHSVLVKLELDNLMSSKIVKLHVLKEASKEVIFGSEFLYGNEFILNYKLGVVQYEDNVT